MFATACLHSIFHQFRTSENKIFSLNVIDITEHPNLLDMIFCPTILQKVWGGLLHPNLMVYCLRVGHKSGNLLEILL